MAVNKNDVVIIELDRKRELRFGHKALKTYQAMTGKELDNMGKDGFDLEDLETLMYCGLMSDARKNGESLSVEDMEDLLDLAPMQNIINKMYEAFNAAFGDNPNVKRTAKK